MNATAQLPHERASALFQRAFGRSPSVTVQAPGRVNLIGEHTDYNDGFVLPCALPFHTAIVLAPRNDARVRAIAADQGETLDEFSVAPGVDIAHNTQLPWANYLRGSLRELRAAGFKPVGCDMAIAGNVPQGAGLSSSAALEVAVLQAQKTLQGLPLDPTRMAQIAQAAENRFVGVNCGIMDQLVSACGVAGHAVLIDCRSLHTRPVPMPSQLAILIVHSHVKRGLVDSEYNIRRQQCEAAAKHFGVKALRDVSLAQLQAEAPRLDRLIYARAHHVVTENGRTLAACDALAAGDARQLSQQMAASHASMRDDFQITVPPIDRLVELLHGVIGEAGGVRMTGGGFGGCVVAVLPHALVSEAQAVLAAHYRSPEGLPASTWVCTASAGAGVISA
jgi:galactokinase